METGSNRDRFLPEIISKENKMNFHHCQIRSVPSNVKFDLPHFVDVSMLYAVK